jgi:hypothetical protein
MKLLVLKIIIGSLLGVAGFGVLSARKSAPTTTSPSPSDTFYYYPKVNIYYDVARGRYIYLAPDGRTWQYAKSISDKFTTGLGKKAVIANPAQPVWKSNEHHKLVYSTSLYASATDFRKDPPKRSIKSQPAITKPAEEKKTRKETGVQRFFKKLFGKKERDSAKKQ